MKEHFTDKELACPCCGLVNYTVDSKVKLNMARTLAGIPFIITSACRCIKHNLEVGGKGTSSHIATKKIQSCAYDISTPTSREKYDILFSLLSAGFNRIGIAKDFIHIDTDENKDGNVIWHY